MATSVRYACHLHSCLLWPSLFLPSLMFKYSLHLWCSFGVAVSSFTIPPAAQNASLCFAVRQTACTAEGIIPTLKLNYERVEEHFVGRACAFFRMSGTFQVKGVRAFPFFVVYFSLYAAQHLRPTGTGYSRQRAL